MNAKQKLTKVVPPPARYTDEDRAKDELRKEQERKEMNAELDKLEPDTGVGKIARDSLLDSSPAAPNKSDAIKGLSEEETVAQSLGITVEEYRTQYLGLPPNSGGAPPAAEEAAEEAAPAAEEAAPAAEEEEEAGGIPATGEEYFKQLDVKGSGFLTWEELIPMAHYLYTSFNPKGSLTSAEVEREAKKLCEKLDLNKDGHVQFNEFVPFFETRKKQADGVKAKHERRKSVTEATGAGAAYFKELDVKNVGFLTWAELRPLAKYMFEGYGGGSIESDSQQLEKEAK